MLVRRRWPLAVLLASAVILQLYYQLDYPGIYPAVPLSVALATAWAAGHRRWSLLIAGLFVVAGIGVGYQALAPHQPALQVLGDVTRDIVLFAAVLLLGEAVRTRRALTLEQERSEGLLLNILPAPIATRLKQHEDVIADGFAEVTVLFADLVDFTRRSQRSSPQQVVQVLDELFSAFDQLTRRQGLEKIKTIGDAYMVRRRPARPPVRPRPSVAEIALAIREEIARRSDPSGQPLQAHRHRHRAGGGRGHRQRQVQLRPVGRYVNNGQPHGVHGVRAAPGHGPCLPTAAGQLPVRAPGGRSRSRARGRWSPPSLSKELMTPRPCHYVPFAQS